MRFTAGSLRALGFFTLLATAAACSDDEDVRITPNTLPSGTIGQFYRQRIDVEGSVGGTPRWSLAFGTLPAGFDDLVGPNETVQPDGSVINSSVGLQGTPEEAGVFTFGLRAEGEDEVIQQSYTLRIRAPVDPLRVTTMSPLPTGEVGVPYEAAVGARGGTESSYGWTVDGGALPNGLELLPAGTLSTRIDGTPTEAGSFMIEVQVRDSAANQATALLELTIQDGTIPLDITTSRLPGGTIGVPYEASVTAVGGTTENYQWEVTNEGGLPAGLSLENGSPTARITGTPEEVVATGITFRVIDSGDNQASRALTLTIAAPPDLLVLTSSTAPARVGEPFQNRLRAFGGVPPYTWSAPQGLPQGLSITGEELTGTPLTAGEFDITIEVEDSVGTTAQRAVPIAIESASLIITTIALPDGATAVPYSQSLEATGGAEPFTWSIEAGALPGGLSLAEDGTISGTPSQFGLFPVRYRVEDADGMFTTRELVLTIEPPTEPLVVVTSTLPAGRVGEGYLAQLNAGGGTTLGYTWSVTSGTLPPGISIEPEGTPSTLLLGFPTVEGSFSFTVQVEDSGAQSATQAFTLSVSTSTVSGG